MILHPPFIITPRLLPGVKIGTAFVSIEFAKETADGRTRYRYHIDTDGFEHTGSDLKSGVGVGSLQSGMESLLSFLGAAAEAARYKMSTGQQSENYDLFPEQVVQWAYNHQDEIQMLEIEIEESGKEQTP